VRPDRRCLCGGVALLALLLVSGAAPSMAAQFPADSGALNVRDFGAKGDGRQDDTAALRAAIAAAGTDTRSFFWRTRIVFLPAGTYRVSAPLMKRYANGQFGSGLILIGESEAATTIRLADHAPGFGDAGAPRGVVMTTSKLIDGGPTSGGKDYTGKGEGNDAYENFVEDLTIDVGAGNPGAVGIDYLANNIGAIRNLRVTAPAGSGAVGISMQRKWPGPALLQHVSVQGFDTGIAVANTEYGVTLEHVRLEGQRRTGLANDSNAVSAADLTITAADTAVANSSAEGLVVLTNSVLRRGSEGATALRNRGAIVAHNVSFDGFAPPQGSSGPLVGVWQGEQWQKQQLPFELSLADAPPEPDDPPAKWVNVLKYRGPSNQAEDITEALRQAMATGAATIYLPHGRYTINDGITIPPTLRRIVGMNSSLTVRPERRPEFARDTGMIRVAQPGPSLTIERLAFDMTDLGEQLAVQVSAQRDVTLRDVVTAGTSLLNRQPGGGRVFLEDVCCGAMHIAGPSAVYARQLDTEGGGTRIINDGSPLAILGLKTEGDCTVLDNRNGARTMILGGLLYVVRDADPKVPAFINHDGTLVASFLEESFRAASRYTIYLRDGDPQRELSAARFPGRGYGRIVPWLTAGH
jgi:hypothetical protein